MISISMKADLVDQSELLTSDYTFMLTHINISFIIVVYLFHFLSLRRSTLEHLSAVIFS